MRIYSPRSIAILCGGHTHAHKTSSTRAATLLAVGFKGCSALHVDCCAALERVLKWNSQLLNGTGISYDPYCYGWVVDGLVTCITDQSPCQLPSSPPFPAFWQPSRRRSFLLPLSRTSGSAERIASSCCRIHGFMQAMTIPRRGLSVLFTPVPCLSQEEQLDQIRAEQKQKTSKGRVIG